MERYIESIIDGWKRIEIHKSLNNEPCNCPGKECKAPPNNWKEYEHYVLDDCLVTVFSPNGD